MRQLSSPQYRLHKFGGHHTELGEVEQGPRRHHWEDDNGGQDLCIRDGG